MMDAAASAALTAETISEHFILDHQFGKVDAETRRIIQTG